MGAVEGFHGLTMRTLYLIPLLVLGAGAKLEFGPVAVANHEAGPKAGCDIDYGWLPGVEGTNKCYMLVKAFDNNVCHSGDDWGYGMSWFDAMQCCYFQHGYLAEPLNAEENDKIKTYLQISVGGDLQQYWWIGGTDMHHEGSWTWMSGAPWMFDSWADGEPNQNGNEDCTAYDCQAGFGWMDLYCDSDDTLGMPHHVVCEKIFE